MKSLYERLRAGEFNTPKDEEITLYERLRAGEFNAPKDEGKSPYERLRAGEFNQPAVPEPPDQTIAEPSTVAPELLPVTDPFAGGYLPPGFAPVKADLAAIAEGAKGLGKTLQHLPTAGMVGAAFSPEEWEVAMKREGVDPEVLNSALIKLGYRGGAIGKNMVNWLITKGLLGPVGVAADTIPAVAKMAPVAKAALGSAATGMVKRGIVDPLTTAGDKPTMRDILGEGAFWGAMGGTGTALRDVAPTIPTMIGRPAKTGLSALAGSLAAAPITEEKETLGGMALNAGFMALFDAANLALNPMERAMAEGQRKNALIQKKVLKPLYEFSQKLNKEMGAISQGDPSKAVSELSRTRDEALSYVEHLARKNKWSPDFEQYAKNVVNSGINETIANFNAQRAAGPSIGQQATPPTAQVPVVSKGVQAPVVKTATPTTGLSIPVQASKLGAGGVFPAGQGQTPTEGVEKLTEPKIEGVVGGEIGGLPPEREPDEVPASKPEPRKPVNKALVNTLRKLAQSLDKQIEAKKNPAIANQNPTARRARIAASMYQEGERLERHQQVLNKLADLHESGDIPESLSKINARTQIDQLEQAMKIAVNRAYQAKAVESYKEDYDDAKHGKFVKLNDMMPPAELNRLKRIGVTNTQQLRQTLKDFSQLAIAKQEPDQAKKIRDMETALIGTKIPGYFPTPKPIAKDMVERADIKPGMKVLEPSAGKGNIADEVPKDADLDVIELNHALSEILKEKGHNIVGSDFLEHKGEYDRIVMNPPFEKGQDIDHVRHAYDLLKPGGKLVSIMSEGTFFRSDKKATEFREWLDEVGGTSEKLPEKSFTGKDADRQTGVSARIVEIEKPTDAEFGGTSGGTRQGAKISGPTHTEEQISAIIKKAGFRDIEEAQEAFYGSGLPILRKKELDNKLAKLPQDKLEQIKLDLQYFAEAKRWKDFTPEEKDKAKKLIREMQKVSSKLKYMRPEYRDAIKAVLDEIDLPVISRRRVTVRKLASLREYVKMVPDNNVPDYLIEKAEILDKKAIRDMTLDELQEVHDTVMGLAKYEELKNILLFKQGKTEFSQVKAQAIANVKKLQLSKRDPKNIDTTDQSLAPKGAKAFFRKHENMETLAQRLDGSQKGIIYKVFYEGIDDGRDEQLGLEQQVFEMIEEGFKKAEIGDIMSFSELFNTKKKNVAYQTVMLHDGKQIRLTKGERIAFLLHSKNKDNRAHILTGGFSFKKDKGTIHNITAKDYKTIIDSATAEERRIADVFSNVYNGIIKNKLNERWVELNGWEVAREENYYPIEVNRMDLDYDPMHPRNRNFSYALLENMGIFKERTKGKNAVVITDAFETMYRHIKKTATYYGLAKPLRNMRMLLLDKDFRQELAKVDGDFSWRMLDQYVKDIETFSTDMEYIDKLATDLMQKIDTSILAFNPWVVLKQPISLILELNEIDGKYLAQAMTMKRDLEEIKKYSPQLRERINGDISVEMGELGKVGVVRKAFTGKTPWTSRMTEGITIMDNITVGITWNAVKLEVKDKHPELEGQEFYKTVAKRTEEIIRHTQSVYDAKDRSELGRSKSLAWRMGTRFTSQRNVTYNAITRVILDYNQSDKTAKDTATLLKKLFILTVVASLAEEMVNKLRDKAYGRDDDETIWETALKVGQNIIGYTYLLGDATDMIIRGVKSGTFMVDYNNPTIQFGEDVIKGIVEVINTITQAVNKDVYKSGPNKGKLKWRYSAKRAAVKAITVASRLKGLPYDNARKLAAAAWDKLTMTDEELKAEMKKAQETKDYKRYAELRQELMKRSRK